MYSLTSSKRSTPPPSPCGPHLLLLLLLLQLQLPQLLLLLLLLLWLLGASACVALRRRVLAEGLPSKRIEHCPNGWHVLVVPGGRH